MIARNNKGEVSFESRSVEKIDSAHDRMSFICDEAGHKAFLEAFLPLPNGPVVTYGWFPDDMVLVFDGGMRFIMQAATERDAWMRAFPWPCPSTHQVTYRWDEKTITFEIKERTAAPAQPATPPKPDTGETPVLSPVLSPEIDHLKAMKKEDFVTYCVERGFSPNPKHSRPQQIAAFLEATSKNTERQQVAESRA